MNDEQTFDEWMVKVDLLLVTYFGFTSEDLVDCAYRDMFDMGDEPRDAAWEALTVNGHPMPDIVYEPDQIIVKAPPKPKFEQLGLDYETQ